jgi:protein Hikeshi
VQVQTDFVQPDQTHFLLNIPNADAINHIVVFLTGQQMFPDGLGGGGGSSSYSTYFFLSCSRSPRSSRVLAAASSSSTSYSRLTFAVYFGWPGQGGETNWQLLGLISNEKPSSIFRVTRLKGAEVAGQGLGSMGGWGGGHDAKIGVSVEPLAEIFAQVSRIASTGPAAATGSANGLSEAATAEKMLQNLFDYVSSFAVAAGQLHAIPGVHSEDAYVPLSAINKWYETCKRRLSLDPFLWRT